MTKCPLCEDPWGNAHLVSSPALLTLLLNHWSLYLMVRTDWVSFFSLPAGKLRGKCVAHFGKVPLPFSTSPVVSPRFRWQGRLRLPSPSIKGRQPPEPLSTPSSLLNLCSLPRQFPGVLGFSCLPDQNCNWPHVIESPRPWSSQVGDGPLHMLMSAEADHPGAVQRLHSVIDVSDSNCCFTPPSVTCGIWSHGCRSSRLMCAFQMGEERRVGPSCMPS